MLVKLITFVPKLHVQRVREAIFEAGGGQIGNYDACSFNVEGYGSFRPNEKAMTFVGNLLQLHYEDETKIEVILPVYLQHRAITALIQAHPYEEPAFDVIPLLNAHKEIGSGIVGELMKPEKTKDFLQRMKNVFDVKIINHKALINENIQKVAVCGGAGSFLLEEAIRAGADIFISGDFKYHQFKAEDKIIIADLGHLRQNSLRKTCF